MKIKAEFIHTKKEKKKRRRKLNAAKFSGKLCQRCKSIVVKKGPQY